MDISIIPVIIIIIIGISYERRLNCIYRNRIYDYNFLLRNINNTIKKYTTKIKNKKEDICIICLDNIYIGDQKRYINYCKHQFHNKCLLKWLNIKLYCPICNQCIN